MRKAVSWTIMSRARSVARGHMMFRHPAMVDIRANDASAKGVSAATQPLFTNPRAGTISGTVAPSGVDSAVQEPHK